MYLVFSKEAFEESLPCKDGKPLWAYCGFISGEHTYEVPVKSNVKIRIRSSLNYKNLNNPVGKDSIRVWLVDADGKPLSYKEKAHLKRVTGWEKRLTKLLRTYYYIGMNLIISCPRCNATMARRRSTGTKRTYLSCNECGSFQWEAKNSKELIKLAVKKARKINKV